jgi:DNA primase
VSVVYRGRQIDPISLWESYVDFPANWTPGNEEFAPLVQCPNPEHSTMKKHFQVNLQKDLVHCFANCGISGTYERAIAMIEGVTHRQARKTIMRHVRISSGVPTDAKRRSRRAASALSAEQLAYDRYIPQAGVTYLRSRGISDSSVARWELGWDSEKLRMVIPVRDSHGRLKFLIRRAVKSSDQPKYLYPDGADTNLLLFGACNIDPGMVSSHGVILVEGSLDTILQHQDGFPNTVGILGSKVSEIQARQIASLRPRKIITMFDADASGVGATFSVANALRRIPIFVCRYPKGRTDPAELSREERERVVSRAISFAAWESLSRSPRPNRQERKSHVG